MPTNYSIQFACHPDDVQNYSTEQLLEQFLIQHLFNTGDINLIYSHYDRFIIGGVKQGSSPLELEPITPLKTDYFIERRELGASRMT